MCDRNPLRHHKRLFDHLLDYAEVLRCVKLSQVFFLTVILRKWKYEVAAVSAMKVYGSVEVELHLLTSGLDGGDWLTSQRSFKT